MDDPHISGALLNCGEAFTFPLMLGALIPHQLLVASTVMGSILSFSIPLNALGDSGLII